MVAILCGCNHENKNKETTTATQESQVDSTLVQPTKSDDNSDETEKEFSDETEIDFSEFE